MADMTDYRYRVFRPPFQDLGIVTVHEMPSPATSQGPNITVLIWYAWGNAKQDQIFDNTDT